MKTIWKNLIGACALVGVTTLVTSRVVSQDYGAAPDADQQKMMEAWMKFATPGPEHARLAKHAGKWHQVNKHWMYPGAEPTVSESTATYESILGGRFLLEKTKGTMEMGGQKQEFEGMGIIGYDNMKQKHFFGWVDNMGTLMMFGEGDENAAGDITYYSELPNPMGPGMSKLKSVSKMMGDDKSVFEMYEQMPDGSWHKQMEITGTRIGAAPMKKGMHEHGNHGR